MENITVLKFGGQLIEKKDLLIPLIKAVKILLEKGKKVIIVHGGSIQADRVLKKLKNKVKKVNGRRITDKKTLEVAKMVYAGFINVDLVALCLKNQIPAVGISGVSCKLAEVEKRPVKYTFNYKTGKREKVDFGFVGDIKRINKEIIVSLLNKSHVPVISCLGVNSSGQVFNINADSLATGIASAVKAKKLIFITDIAGIWVKKDLSTYFNSLTVSKAQMLIKKGKITGGMIPKIESAKTAFNNGIKSLQIVGGLRSKDKWLEAISKNAYGTVIYGEKT